MSVELVPARPDDPEMSIEHPGDAAELDPTRPSDFDLCSEDDAWWH